MDRQKHEIQERTWSQLVQHPLPLFSLPLRSLIIPSDQAPSPGPSVHSTLFISLLNHEKSFLWWEKRENEQESSAELTDRQTEAHVSFFPFVTRERERDEQLHPGWESRQTGFKRKRKEWTARKEKRKEEMKKPRSLYEWMTHTEWVSLSSWGGTLFSLSLFLLLPKKILLHEFYPLNFLMLFFSDFFLPLLGIAAYAGQGSLLFFLLKSLSFRELLVAAPSSLTSLVFFSLLYFFLTPQDKELTLNSFLGLNASLVLSSDFASDFFRWLIVRRTLPALGNYLLFHRLSLLDSRETCEGNSR